MNRLRNATRVQHRPTGRWGVTCPDFMGGCEADETPVVYDGTSEFEGTATRDLFVRGPENAKPDPERCGMGQGENCCAFLTAGSTGFSCERHTAYRWAIIMRRDIGAQRQPTAPYPACMDRKLAPARAKE